MSINNKELKKNTLAKGQSLVEVATLFALVGLAILAMQVYVQRNIQGKTKDLTDAIINQDGLALRASSAESEESNTNTTSSGQTRVTTFNGGAVNKEIIQDETVTSSYSRTVF